MCAGTEAARSQARIGLLAGANHRVEPLLDHIDHAVAKIDIQFDFRIPLHEPVKGRHHQVAE
ncbi:hypothetical protein D3C78_1000560 [compost metagenome]